MKAFPRFSVAAIFKAFLLISFCVTGPMLVAQSLRTDSVTMAIAPAYDSVSSFHRFWLGEGYRKLWAAPIRIKVLDLAKEKGGLTVQGIGGGFQTRSLRLKDASGRQWALRSVQKYPERGLPAHLRNTVAQRILHDQVITVHPFGALTVPVLAKALGVLHTNPQVVFVPDDPLLGDYRKDFANSILLFEERGAIDSFKTINTETVQAELEGPNAPAVNQKAVLRARLLDMLLGDWDRHEGQWRWELRKEGNEPVYFPVPHDRDYVFYNTTGVLPWLVARQWQTARFQGFRDEIDFIETYNFNNRFFDRYFLHSLTEADWKEQVGVVQKALTDDVIKQAVERMPDTIVALTGEHIVKTLMTRRNNLTEDALDYYHFLSHTVDVPASADAENIQVQYLENGRIAVAVRKEGSVRYQREFDPAVTKEIRLYGMAGSDAFSVAGTGVSPIRIRLIGGDGKDSFVVAGQPSNSRNLFIYDRKDEPNVYAGKFRLRTGTDTLVNTYNRRNFRYNLSNFLLNLFFNIDQRTFASIGWVFEKQGFRKEPYVSRHEITGGYSPARGSFAFRYNGDWRQVFGKYGLNLNLLGIGPRNQSNFFGTGNETAITVGNSRRLYYYRTLYDLVIADLRLRRPINRKASWSAGVAAEYYSSSAKDNAFKFLKDYDNKNPGEAVFANRMYAGLGAGIDVDTRPTILQPKSGMLFHLDLRALSQLNRESRSFGAIRTDIQFFTRLTPDSGLVLVNRIGAGTTIGTPLFYQLMHIGGNRNLRGYNLNRFTGRSMFYHNAEVRLDVLHFTSFLFPGTIGLIGFNDIGRVWMPGEKSTTLHHGYGGGLYLIPANVVMISAVLGKSAESTQAYINLVYGL